MTTATRIVREGESTADACRRLGWTPGTVIEGDEGYGPTRIRITAVGERHILAVVLSRKGRTPACAVETLWTLRDRDWREATR